MNRKSKAFTLAEIIIVMMLIAFLWTCVVKVINKNMENKVKVYLFNIYNELQYAGKATDKTLSKNKNESIQDILLETNAINYCDAFVSNINSSNAVDCVQVKVFKILGLTSFLTINSEVPCTQSTALEELMFETKASQ
mgnify:CR=1 FL=1